MQCQSRPDQFQPIVCSTGQHREMLAQVLGYFGITPDIDLGLMKPGQTLTGLTSACLQAVDEVIQQQKPDCVVAQATHDHDGGGDGRVLPSHLCCPSSKNLPLLVKDQLGGLDNVHLVSPADYPEFVWLMDQVSVVLTDSGGVQEKGTLVASYCAV